MRIIKIAVIIIATVLLTWSGIELTIGWTVANEIWAETVSIIVTIFAFAPVWLGLLYGVCTGYITKLFPGGRGLPILFFTGIPTAVLLYCFLITYTIETVMLALCMLISYTATAGTVLVLHNESSD